MNEYEKQAQDFLKATGTSLKLQYVGHDYYFHGDKDRRDIWKFTLKNKNGQYSARFGQSIVNVGKTPTAYDILSCLGSYYSDNFEEFCQEFGYEYEYEPKKEKQKIMKIFKACKREEAGMLRLFTEEQIEKLQDIA